jgi:hypothetical protein
VEISPSAIIQTFFQPKTAPDNAVDMDKMAAKFSALQPGTGESAAEPTQKTVPQNNEHAQTLFNAQRAAQEQ